MSEQYIAAIKVVDHFGATKYVCEFMGSDANDTYQEALNKATSLAIMKKNEKPITRVDGLEFRDKSVTSVVLKEVKMVEQQ